MVQYCAFDHFFSSSFAGRKTNISLILWKTLGYLAVSTYFVLSCVFAPHFHFSIIYLFLIAVVLGFSDGDSGNSKTLLHSLHQVQQR